MGVSIKITNALNITDANTTLSNERKFIKFNTANGGKAVVNKAGTITKYLATSLLEFQ